MIKNRAFLFLIVSIAFATRAEQTHISKRFVPVAQTASLVGNWALWHNPAGLAFMGGGESALLYLYEWSEDGNRHHGGGNLAYNFLQSFTLAFGVNTQAAFLPSAKANLGTDISGIAGAAIKITDYTGFGISFLKSHNFRADASTPTLITFGLQARPFSFLSIGSHYEEVDGAYFAAPNITAGLSVRPYKEFFTIGLDGRFVAKGKYWENGFNVHPIISIKSAFRGYGAGISAEIPGLPQGFRKPIFSLLMDFNFAHMGVSMASVVNSGENNFALGSALRTSSEEWQSISRPKGLWVELTIDHDGRLERKPKTLAERLFSIPEDALSVLALLKRLEQDPSIGHVVLNFNGFGFGDARAQEWRNALVALRNAQKEVIVYLDAPSERDFYIATAANKIHMNQYGSMSFRNFQATLTYFADLLQKLGVKAESVVAGSYKTAPRQWTHSRPQKEEIEITANILNSFYENLLNEVEKSRNINRETLKALFDKGEITAIDAKNAGLVDELIAPKGLDDPTITKPGMYFANYEDRVLKRDKWHPPKKIVVIPIIDTIADGRSLPGIFSWLFPSTGAKDVIDQIENAITDDKVIGLIIRIDSPGGEAGAGSRIHQALLAAQKIKPVVTSMSDVAASAGYMIAAGTGHILALPNTITGSIGVFSLMFSGEQLAQKIGVFSKELTPIRNPGPTPFRAMTEEERKEAERLTNWFYQNFIDVVSVGLELEKSEVEKLAEGRVWLGQEALERKLIHEIGGFSEAVESVRVLAEIPEGEELTIEIRSPGQSEQFSLTAGLTALFQSKSEKDKKAISQIASPYLKAFEAYRLNSVPQARLPYDIEWRR